MKQPKLLLLLTLVLTACKTVQPTGQYTSSDIPTAPDYSKLSHWAAHPEKADPADQRPEPYLKDLQKESTVDVFFLHPTTYTGSKGEDQWNGPIDNEKLNKKTDNGTILHQASIFNGSGRVFAPRYRQAHYHAYFTQNKSAAKKAFTLAYQDIKQAFDYYLKYYNNNRPIIIAAHSQGTTHAKTLLKEYFDGKVLNKQLVAAYIVGISVEDNYFEQIRPCLSSTDNGCFCSWRTWQRGHYPKAFEQNNNIVTTNPLIWTTDQTYAPKTKNEGSVLRKFHKGFKPELVDAQVHDGLLWVNKPKFFGSIFLKTKNYHAADFNLFYLNVRNNAQERIAAFWNKN